MRNTHLPSQETIPATHHQSPPTSNLNRFATISQGAMLRPAFSVAALRDYKFKAYDRTNSKGEVIRGNGSGPAGVWVQMGAKVLIDIDAFDRWVASHRATQAASNGFVKSNASARNITARKGE